MDGMDDAAQLKLYSVDDWQPMQLDEAWHDMTESTYTSSCILYTLKWLQCRPRQSSQRAVTVV